GRWMRQMQTGCSRHGFLPFAPFELTAQRVLYLRQPAVLVRGLPALQGNEGGTQRLGLRTDLSVPDPMVTPCVNECAHAREHCRRSRERSLALADRAEGLFHVEDPLLDRVAEVTGECEQRIARDAVQEGRIETARQNALVADQQKVGRAGLL